jgi:ankyrin repeat protein
MPQLNSSRKLVIVLLAVLGLMPGVGAAQEGKKQPDKEVKAFIDQLTQIDRQDIGYSASTTGSAFLPLGQSHMGTGLLFQQPNEASEALRSLVKLGVKALPELIAHLKDDRPTKIVLKHQGFFGGMFIEKDEDDAKRQGKKEEEKKPAGGAFGAAETRYTVTVGDLCYVAIGQIVNRNYWAVRYQPTAIILVNSVPRSKKLRDEVAKQWGNLTAEKHRESLVHDLLDTDNEYLRNGASLRLAYYYPAALEAAALKQLARSSYSIGAVQDLVRGPLYKATTAKQRKKLVDEFVTKHGDVAREGIRSYLFDDLSTVEADEEGRLYPKLDKRYPARQCLIDVFGLPATVKSKDQPAAQPLDDATQARFVQTLHYDTSAKLDRALGDLLSRTDDDYLATGCLDRLVGRGYDAAIETYLRRRLPHLKEREQDELRAYERKLGWTRLHAAVDLGVLDLVGRAIKENVPVNARGRDGRTALHVAAAAGNGSACKMLLAAKANPNVKDNQGRLPVQLAANEDYPKVVRLLVAEKSEVPDVFVAATVGNVERMGELLKKNAEAVKLRNQDGLTPLHVAVREGHRPAVEALIAAGADVKAVDEPKGKYRSSNGWTPLHYASMVGRTAIAKLLLEKGADVNAADRRGKDTALHFAAFGGHAELVRLLLDRGADRNVKDSEKRTPLDLAREKQHTAVIKLLEK